MTSQDTMNFDKQAADKDDSHIVTDSAATVTSSRTCPQLKKLQQQQQPKSSSFSTEMQSPLSTFDSGFASGCSSSGFDPLHKPAAVQVVTEQVVDVQREYNRADSGICDSINSLSLNEMPDKKLLQHQKDALVQPPAAATAAGDVTLPDDVLAFFDADEDGDCQLHLAIADGNIDVVFALIRMAPHSACLDIQNNELYAPLHIAVLVNQPKMVRRLVIFGAITHIRDREGNTPLHLAAKRGLIECAQALLAPISTEELRDAGLPSAARNTPLHAVLNMKNYNGEHCVHLATIDRHLWFLFFLSWLRADMNAVEGRSGKTALHYAVNMGHFEMVQILTTSQPGGCGPVALNTRDWAGRTAFQCAKINGLTEIVAWLGSLPNCDTTCGGGNGDDSSDEDFEFDTDEDMNNATAAAGSDLTDLELNGVRIVESTA